MQSQSIQRILLSLGMVVFVGALAAGATGAFFSDTETSTGNTFAAGAIDLQIDNTSYGFDWNNPAIPLEQATGVWGPNAANSWAVSDLTNQLFFTFRDLKPGDYGEDTISIHVDNNDAYACMAFDLTATPDNGINEPEADAGDITDGDGGELQNYLSFMFWYDDGDNVLETGETVIPELSGLPGSVFTGGWLPIAEAGDEPLAGGSTEFIGKGWCFGTMTATPVAQDGVNTNPPSAPARVGFTCDGAGNHNVAQTDGITVDVAFHAVQSRNNAGFLCSTLPPLEGTTPPVVDPAINQSDLATSTGDVIARPTSWFFYNDTNDTIMTIDQFSGSGGQNHMELVAGEEGAKMVLHDATSRYNIATAQYGNIALSTISPLTYRIYDDSASPETPYLHFNVDFFNTGSFQSRLVMVPTVAAGNDGVPTDTWTTVDAIDGGTAMWTYSGAFWPAGGSETGVTPGTTPKSWASILADYPLIETLASPASFLGVRVGHPGPAGETSFVSSINFDGAISDFEI